MTELADLRLVVFDFDGVFTDNRVWTNERGEESVACWRGDALGLRRLEAVGVEHLILSTEVNQAVGARARKIRATCIQAVEEWRKHQPDLVTMPPSVATVDSNTVRMAVPRATPLVTWLPAAVVALLIVSWAVVIFLVEPARFAVVAPENRKPRGVLVLRQSYQLRTIGGSATSSRWGEPGH